MKSVISFDTGITILQYLILFCLPVLIVTRMKHVGMTTKEMLLTFIPFYGLKYRYKVFIKINPEKVHRHTPFVRSKTAYWLKNMKKSALNFWLLFGISIIISAIIISFFVKMLKAVLFVILVFALAPVIYLILRLILPGKKPTDDDDKLKTRH